MEEVWKSIKNYEGLYEISNLGNVKSLVNNKCVEREKVLKHIIGKGYKRVILYKNNKKKRYFIHRLVAQAFIENPNNYPFINHKDENGENNNVENLEWCNHRYNCNFGTRNVRISKSLSKEVYQYSKEGELIAVWKSTNECGRNGFNQGSVVSCCNGKLKTHKGYIWSYTPLNNKSS